MRRAERQARRSLPGLAGAGYREWQERGSSSLSKGNDERRATTKTKAVCGNCNQDVVIDEIDGERVVTDTEIIRVVALRGDRRPQPVRRLHAERCEKLKADAAREKVKAEILAWQREQKRDRKNAQVKSARQRAGR